MCGLSMSWRQKAPSAKRCIKTSVLWPSWPSNSSLSESTERQTVHQDGRIEGCIDVVLVGVRKHRAPNGALRLDRLAVAGREAERLVRKHRAPNGALIPEGVEVEEVGNVGVRKHRAPNGALRRDRSASLCFFFSAWSESTERHTVH